MPPSEELRAFSRQPMSDLIVRGVLIGLIHRPALIARHSETLSEFVTLADHWADLLDALLDASHRPGADGLDPPTLMTILQSRGLADAVDRLKSGGKPPFSFCIPAIEPPDQLREARIAEDFAEAIEVMITRPRLEAALQEPELKLMRATLLVDYHVRRNKVAKTSHDKTWKRKHRKVKFLRL